MLTEVCAFGTLVCVPFVRMFVVPGVPRPEHGGQTMRAAIALLVVLVGIVLVAVSYLFLVSVSSSPRLDGPMLFLFSILLLPFGVAAYAMVAEKRAR
ncbi:MAG: hypothetical protein HY691_02105 [Chloroflexi bacterium]|nr:hypothetical protein [Chloroflexota bacterium]